MATTRPPRDDVRSALVRAAAELFLDQGYEATTVDQIAARAGFTKGAVYSNFGTKPELLAAAAADWFPGRSGSMIQAATLLGDQNDRLAAQLAELVVLDSWFLVMNEFRMVAQRDPAVAAVYARLRRQHQAELAEQLRAGRGGLGLSPDVDPDAAAVLLLTVISGLVMERAAAPSVLTPAVVEAAFEQLLRGLRP